MSAEDPFEHDAAILRNVRAVLKLGAPFVLTASNGMRLIRDATVGQIAKGAFDPITLTLSYHVWHAPSRSSTAPAPIWQPSTLLRMPPELEVSGVLISRPQHRKSKPICAMASFVRS